jgi:hypothetical protein
VNHGVHHYTDTKQRRRVFHWARANNDRGAGNRQLWPSGQFAATANLGTASLGAVTVRCILKWIGSSIPSIGENPPNRPATHAESVSITVAIAPPIPTITAPSTVSMPDSGVFVPVVVTTNDNTRVAEVRCWDSIDPEKERRCLDWLAVGAKRRRRKAGPAELGG